MYTISRFLERSAKPLYWAYHRFRNSWSVWCYLLNRRSRRVWKRHRARLNEIQSRIVAQLNQDGIAVIHISELFPEPEIWQNMEREAFALLNSPRAKQAIAQREAHPPSDKDEIMVHLYGGYGANDQYPLETKHPFMRFALDERMLAVAGAYLSLAPKFKMYSLHSMILLSSGAPQLFSQRWHRDPDDKKLVKCFLYFTDVDTVGDGPFTYIKGSHLGGRWRSIFPQVPPVGSYPSQGAVEKIVPPEDICVCLGKAGTLVFADTSGLHRGGHSTTRRRLMFAGTYTSAASLLNRKYVVADPATLSSLSALQRYALED